MRWYEDEGPAQQEFEPSTAQVNGATMLPTELTKLAHHTQESIQKYIREKHAIFRMILNAHENSNLPSLLIRIAL